MLSYLRDAFYCVMNVLIISALYWLDLITDPALALAGAALWWGVRAYGKASDVNTAHKNSEG